MGRHALPHTCSNCNHKCETVYFCPKCGKEICFNCIHGKGHEMEMALGDFLCKKCKEKKHG